MTDQPNVDPTRPVDVPPPPPPAWGTAPVPPPPPAEPSYQAPQAPIPPAYQAPTAPVPPAYPPQGYAAPAAGVQPLSATESRQWAMFAHLGGIILGFVGPLIVMLVYGPRDGFTRDQSVEALNFQITALIAWIASLILTAILPIPWTLVVWIAVLVLAIMGGLAANKGETYRYPFALRLVK